MGKLTGNRDKSKRESELFTAVFNQKNRWWLVIALIAITFIIFSPSLNNDFVRWDDNQYVTENELVKDISLNNLGKFGDNVAGNFHPLTMISLALDYHFFGLNPFYFHLKNLIFHLLNTVLVFFFIMKVSKNNYFVSFFTALLFGIHPMHVESVAWVSERKDVLYTFYFLTGLLLYYEYVQRKKKLFYFLSLIAFVFSTLSKSAAVVFPLVLLLIDYCEKGKFELKGLFQKVPFFVLALVIGIIALKTQSDAGAVEKTDFTFFGRIRMATGGNWEYIRKFLFPEPLTNYYPIPNFNNNSFFYFQSILVFVLLFFLIIRYFKRNWWVSWGLIFYFTTIILVLQFLQVGGSFVSDRYTYMPYIGLGFTYFMLIFFLLKRFEKMKYVIISGMVLQFGFWAVNAYSQTKVWNNTGTLWNNFIDKFPNESSKAHNNLAEYYLMQGDTIKAEIEVDKSIESDGNNYKAYTMKGRIFYELKEYQTALNAFSKALEIEKNYKEALKGRSAAYYFIGDFQNAFDDIEMYFKQDSTDVEALNLRGNIYIQKNELDLALEDFNNAIQLNTEHKASINNRNLVLALKNDSSAQQQFTDIIKSDNENYEALTNRGVVQYKNGNLDEALDYFNRALQINNNYPEALRGRAAIYFEQKRYKEAIPDITAFLKVNPTNYDMLNRRAQCYFMTNQLPNAIDDLNQLISVQPSNGALYHGRGLIYLKLGDKKKALDDLLMANELGVKVDANILRALQTQ